MPFNCSVVSFVSIKKTNGSFFLQCSLESVNYSEVPKFPTVPAYYTHCVRRCCVAATADPRLSAISLPKAFISSSRRFWVKHLFIFFQRCPLHGPLAQVYAMYQFSSPPKIQCYGLGEYWQCDVSLRCVVQM